MNLNEIINMIQNEINKSTNIDEKISLINEIRKSISEVSPFRSEPCDCVIWEKQENIQANEYNPNKVATPEMRLLYESIKNDGYTMPIVTYVMDNGKREIVDGFHRNRIGKERKDINKRIHGYLPVSTIDKPLAERIGSTIRHNRARGTHAIRSMSDIVLELTKMGWTDDRICKDLGMELDEVIRLKQITGLKEAFSSHEFSRSWEEFEKKYYSKKGEEK